MKSRRLIRRLLFPFFVFFNYNLGDAFVGKELLSYFLPKIFGVFPHLVTHGFWANDGEDVCVLDIPPFEGVPVGSDRRVEFSVGASFVLWLIAKILSDEPDLPVFMAMLVFLKQHLEFLNLAREGIGTVPHIFFDAESFRNNPLLP